ncbi:hypothetical protein CYMTET_10793 [Cymbomonas tetramitiformis]|uniref:Uncharacterized protein n=1 Tax=Cymbomonas tetramitiformis TaxID=36881 RepID=A0AAE0LE38_9CHLO|nr:hypothetical protein CYMTET_10793 [Cymbomonas tetramitiformis]
MQEGRCALATSFATFKFLVIYGLCFSVMKLISFRFGIVLPMMDYLMFDGVAIVVLSMTMTLSQPNLHLGAMRPTSSLLGSSTIASVLGMMAVNWSFLAGIIAWMRVHDDYVEWPSEYAEMTDWWTLGDNWESTVLYVTVFLQFITSSVIFSFGSAYRRTVTSNWPLLASWGALFALTSSAFLMDDSAFTQIWHMASHQYNDEEPTNKVWRSYQDAGPDRDALLDDEEVLPIMMYV